MSKRFVLVCIILALAMLACSLGNNIAPSVSSQPSAAAPMPASTSSAPLAGEAQFILTTPRGESMNLQFTCDGLGAGQYLEINAQNTVDPADPKRVVVQINGMHDSADGQAGNMYVMVTIGANASETFMGNTSSAVVTLNKDGSGSLSDVSIINVAVVSPDYQYGVEYPFNAQWTCKK
ncbi:MAG: hypothetical protein ACOYYJ_19375 [Chloroflexota bacterium]